MVDVLNRYAKCDEVRGRRSEGGGGRSWDLHGPPGSLLEDGKHLPALRGVGEHLFAGRCREVQGGVEGRCRVVQGGWREGAGEGQHLVDEI